jgi:D-aminoacyl-tRNA deacylase
MKIALVSSRQDPGGKTIRRGIDRLLSSPGRSRFPLEDHDLTFHETDGRLIEQDGLDQSLPAGLIIFLSRHTSLDPVPVLTTHVTGNIGKADLGGRPGSVAVSAPEWMHTVLQGLSRYAPPGYRVSYEVTHHGPSELATPSLFVEIGSTEKEWADEQAGEAVARAVLEASLQDTIPVVGIGGTHYSRRETEIALQSRAAFGHIVHSREAGLVDTGMLRLLAGKSGARAVYIDRKALTPQETSRLSAVIREAGLLRLSETELINLQRLSLDSWEMIVRLAREIDPRAEVTVTGMLGEGAFRVLSFPPELLREAFRAGAEALKEGLGKIPLAYLTTPGSQVMPGFITTEEKSPEVLNDLISLCVTLISRGENTAIEGDSLVIRRSKFDPSKASRLGVPEGPLFGKLMGGRTLTIDGRDITPDMVCSSEIVRIRIPGMEKKICDP